MFGRLFGKKKKKIDPEEQKRLDKLKKEKAQEESKENLEKTIAKNEKQIADLEEKLTKANTSQVSSEPVTDALQQLLHLVNTQGEHAALDWARDQCASGGGGGSRQVSSLCADRHTMFGLDLLPTNSSTPFMSFLVIGWIYVSDGWNPSRFANDEIPKFRKYYGNSNTSEDLSAGINSIS